MPSAGVPGLGALARSYGIQTSYFDVDGRRRQASADALLGALESLGAPITAASNVPGALREHRLAHWREPLEPVAAVWLDEQPAVELRLPAAEAAKTLRLSLTLESGETRAWTVEPGGLPLVERVAVEGLAFERRRLSLPGPLPVGYHRLSLERGSQTAECLVIAAPRRTYAAAGRDWGLFLPLYALRTAHSGGVGDFRDLRALAEWTARHGGNVVATLPLLASYLDEPCDYSPYTPVSRLFWNELYVDVEASAAGCPAAEAVVREPRYGMQRQALRDAALVDYRGQFRLNRRVIEAVAAGLPEATPATADAELLGYARFRATAEKQGRTWRSWPARLRNGDLRPGDYDDTAARYHLVAQQIAEAQLAGCGEAFRRRGQRFYLDYPVGVHPEGFDTWRRRDLFAGASVGAPPDSFYTKGQDWGFQPLVPEALRREGYDYLIACLRHHLRHADVLRIDHVMGLHRLYWIGRGLDARQGVYVRYPAEEMYAVLSVESHRHQAVIVGEDLGTVPGQVRRAMARHAVGGSYVVELELRDDTAQALRPPPARSVASLNTHDMPPFAAYGRGLDIDDRSELGHVGRDRVAADHKARRRLTAALRRFLAGRGLLGEAAKEEERAVLAASTAFIARSRAALVLLNAEDLWLETEPQNVPGTTDQRPNWRRKARYRLEEWENLPGVTELLTRLNDLRNLS